MGSCALILDVMPEATGEPSEYSLCLLLSRSFTLTLMLSIPITASQFASLATRLRTNGIDMVGDTGTLTKDGVTAQYTHADGRLTIEITDAGKSI
jgi:hypothetical protein